MSMITGVLGTLGLFTAWFAGMFGIDLNKNKGNLEDNSVPLAIGMGFVVNFFDTLGIGSFAPLTALVKFTKQTKDKLIPGTLNVSCAIPVIVEAFIFIKIIEVEAVTLTSMLFAATIGAWLGAGVVAKLPEKKIQIIMGVALLVTVVLMIAGQVNLMPGGGEALGLSGGKLVVAVIVNFILGALMTAGIGLYAPCMAFVYLLGMSPKVAFPIMMGSCAFLMPTASVKFIREGAYDRKTSLGVTLGGIIGVFIAAYIVKSLPLNILRWLVDCIIIYTAITMLRSARKNGDVMPETGEKIA